MSSLTHTLTHTGKSPYGTSGTRSAKEDAEGEGKGLKMPIQRHLKGFGTFVISRSRVRVTSLAPKIPVNGLFAGVLCILVWAMQGSDPLPDPQAEST